MSLFLCVRRFYMIYCFAFQHPDKNFNSDTNFSSKKKKYMWKKKVLKRDHICYLQWEMLFADNKHCSFIMTLIANHTLHNINEC